MLQTRDYERRYERCSCSWWCEPCQTEWHREFRTEIKPMLDRMSVEEIREVIDTDIARGALRRGY